MTERGMRYNLKSPAKKIKAHILLPKGRACSRLLVNGVEAAFTLSPVGESVYVDAVVEPTAGVADFELLWCIEKSECHLDQRG